MITKTEQATQTQAVAAKPPMGQKALDMISNTVRTSMRYHSGVRNLSAMRTSVVRFLIPDGGCYIPCNCDGYLIGQTEPNLNIGREWVIPKSAVQAAGHMGLTTDANGVIDLFVRGIAPWVDEFCYKPWSARACAICGIDAGQLFSESCSPQPRMFGSNSSILHD